MKRVRITSVAFAAAVAFAQAVAYAQAAADTQREAKTTPAGGIEEIVVTAQKRAENIQDVPMSITAITERSLEMLGASNSAGYVGTIPGLSFQSIGPAGGQNGDRSISIRGISAETGADTVGFYINETPMQFVDPNIFDVNRIEVLRGPQGTLYGASSMGGTIRLITNQPDPTHFAGKIDANFSGTEHGGKNVDLAGMANLPLIADRLALRVVGFNRDESGFIDNIVRATEDPSSPSVPPPVNRGISDVEENFNTEHVRGGRAALQLRVNGDFTITPSVMRQTLEVGGDPQYKVILDESDPAFQVGSVQPLVDDFTHNSLVTHQPNSSKQKEQYTIYDVTMEYAPGDYALVSSSSYFDRSKSGILDMAIILPALFGPDAPVRNNLDDFDQSHGVAQEVRLAYNGTERFKWVLGAFYQEVDKHFHQSLVDTTFNDVVFGGFPVVPNGIFLAFDSKSNEKHKALFADATYKLTDALALTAGLRYFDDRLDAHTTGDGLFNGGPTLTDAKAHDNGTNPRVLVSYNLSPDKMVYATASKGFRPGFGLEPVGTTCDEALIALGLALDRTQVGPDKLWNYELGIKSAFADRRITMNGAVYQIDWSDIQQRISLGECGFSTTINGGKARSRGAELEVSALPTEDFEITAGASYVDSQLTEDAPQLGAEDGDPILRVSKWNFSFAGTYSFELKPQFDAYVRADYQYTGKSQNGYDFSSPVAAFTNRRPAFDVVNLRAAVRHDDWEFALFAQNLLDERPRIGAVQFITPDVNVYTLRPRTIGLNVKRAFN